MHLRAALLNFQNNTNRNVEIEISKQTPIYRRTDKERMSPVNPTAYNINNFVYHWIEILGIWI